MNLYPATPGDELQIQAFIAGKPECTLQLLQIFLNEYCQIGPIATEATKTMIGITNGHKRIAWITQLGRSFIHVVFPFSKPYDNFCFQKVGQVPGSKQYNHHLRILQLADINDEVKHFMQLAFREEG